MFNHLISLDFTPITFYQKTKHIKSRKSKRKLCVNNEQSNIDYNDSLNSKNIAELSSNITKIHLGVLLFSTLS